MLTNPKKDEEVIPLSAANVVRVVWFRKPEDYKKLKQLQRNGGGGGKGSAKGVPGHVVLICLKDEIDGGNGTGTVFRNKPLGQVCFQLPSYPPPSSADNDGGNVNSQQLTEEVWWNGLSTALFSCNTSSNGMIRVQATMDRPEYAKGKSAGYTFQSEGEAGSTTTTEGMPYVGCYQGFNDGALFPLREGLLFFK